MNVQEEKVDLRIMDPARIEEGRRGAELLFRLHQTMPMTDEYREILKDLWRDWRKQLCIYTHLLHCLSIGCPHRQKRLY